jgi:hypothetical protein
MTTPLPPCAEAALTYAAAGFLVIPLWWPTDTGCACKRLGCGSPGKHPIGLPGGAPHWREDATSDPEVIARWWARWPSANVGIVTGYVSRVWVLDVDAGKEGEAHLFAEAERHGGMPITLTARTGSGGWHYFFRLTGSVSGHIADMGLEPLGNPVAAGNKIGIDARAEGGLVVAAPSRHKSGGSYEWLDGTGDIAEAPDWILKLVCKPRPTPREAPPLPPRAPGSATRREAYGAAVLRTACQAIQRLRKGERHNGIRAHSRVVGGYVASGCINRSTAETALISAGLVADSGVEPMPEWEVQGAVLWGLDKGETEPLEPNLEERPRNQSEAPRASVGMGSEPRPYDGPPPGYEGPPPDWNPDGDPRGQTAEERDEARAAEEAERRAKARAELEGERVGTFTAEALARMLARARDEERPIPLPWPSLASALGGGLWPGLHVLVGNTGTGKSQLALEAALKAASKGTPVLYVGLELGKVDLVARLAGLLTNRKWSRLFLGRNSEGHPDPSELLRIESDVTRELADLPFHLTFGPPNGWDYTTLHSKALAMREMYPETIGPDGTPIAGSRPFLVVLDFLQIVGSPDERGHEELRERIGRASYQGRAVARDLNAAVVLVSSTARDNYAILDNGDPETVRPGTLVGLGKESGEIEYSADSVMVLVREWFKREHNPMHDDESLVHVAVAKVRAGGPEWRMLAFNGGRFREVRAEERARIPECRAKGREKKKSGKDAAETAAANAEILAGRAGKPPAPTFEEL